MQSPMFSPKRTIKGPNRYRGNMTTKNSAQKFDLFPGGLPQIVPRQKEMGGGGLIYPGAQHRLLDILKSPTHDQDLNNKLLHNARVFSYFHDPLKNKANPASDARDVICGSPNNNVLKFNSSAMLGTNSFLDTHGSMNKSLD